MKKSLLIKSGKAILIVLGTGFLSLLVWANWNARTYTEKLVGNTQFITYDLSNASALNPLLLEKRISVIDGVSSCSVNGATKIAGVIFYTSKLTPGELQSKLKNTLGYAVSEKILPIQKGGCPVGGIRYFMLGLKEALCFRS
ncbi:MAG: heavy-metal-associated domain-containing protein [Bacteroidota bacterium]